MRVEKRQTLPGSCPAAADCQRKAAFGSRVIVRAGWKQVDSKPSSGASWPEAGETVTPLFTAGAEGKQAEAGRRNSGNEGAVQAH